ncbi:MAG: TRAP transporter small permease [Bacteroidaceae bacterium]|nr:TRAP transporter small permease [Bacteroidaceae bacterium]
MKLLHWFDENLEEVLMAFLLIGISVIIIVQVFARYLFNSSLTWSDELTRYFLIWSAFLSVSYCVKKRISIKIEQLQNSLSNPIIPWVRMIRHTIVFLFCLIMLPYALTYVQQSIENGSTSSALKIPMYYIQSAPLVCFILLSFRVAQAWIWEFRLSWRYMMKTLRLQLKASTQKTKRARQLSKKERYRQEIIDELKRKGWTPPKEGGEA